MYVRHLRRTLLQQLKRVALRCVTLRYVTLRYRMYREARLPQYEKARVSFVPLTDAATAFSQQCRIHPQEQIHMA